jgi:hypothetical protein
VNWLRPSNDVLYSHPYMSVELPREASDSGSTDLGTGKVYTGMVKRAK